MVKINPAVDFGLAEFTINGKKIRVDEISINDEKYRAVSFYGDVTRVGSSTYSFLLLTNEVGNYFIAAFALNTDRTEFSFTSIFDITQSFSRNAISNEGILPPALLTNSNGTFEFLSIPDLSINAYAYARFRFAGGRFRMLATSQRTIQNSREFREIYNNANLPDTEYAENILLQYTTQNNSILARATEVVEAEAVQAKADSEPGIAIAKPINLMVLTGAPVNFGKKVTSSVVHYDIFTDRIGFKKTVYEDIITQARQKINGDIIYTIADALSLFLVSGTSYAVYGLTDENEGQRYIGVSNLITGTMTILPTDFSDLYYQYYQEVSLDTISITATNMFMNLYSSNRLANPGAGLEPGIDVGISSNSISYALSINNFSGEQKLEKYIGNSLGDGLVAYGASSQLAWGFDFRGSLITANQFGTIYTSVNYSTDTRSIGLPYISLQANQTFNLASSVSDGLALNIVSYTYPFGSR